MKTTQRNVKIRPFRPEDRKVAEQILHESNQAGAWPPPSHDETSHDEHGHTETLAFVAEENNVITGVILARRIADEAEILNVAIKPQSRRSGQGSALLLATSEEFQRNRVRRVFLEVRESNAAATAFYHKHGFVPVGRRKGYYRDPDEDAVLMEKILTS